MRSLIRSWRVLALVAAVAAGGGMVVRNVAPAGAPVVRWSVTDDAGGRQVVATAASGTAALAGTYYGGLLRTVNRSSSRVLNASVLSLARDPADPAVLYAGTRFEGVLRSSDGGATWNDDSAGLPADDVYSLVFAGGRLFAGTSAGVFRRGVAAWEAASAGLSARNVYALAAGPTELLGGTLVLYAGTDHGVFSSINLGLTWTAQSTGIGDQPVHALAASGLAVVAGTTRGLYRSSTAGATWTRPDPDPGAMPVRALLAHDVLPNVFFAGTSRGVLLSVLSGDRWLELNDGLPAGARGVLSLSQSGGCPEKIYAGTVQGLWEFRYTGCSV